MTQNQKENRKERAALVEPLLPEVAEQIAAVELDPERPLIISDADEVLLQFVAGLERFLEANGLWLDLTSFALTGNIKHKDSGEPAKGALIKDMLARFFAEEAENLIAVPGAADALQSLSRDAQVVVLTNVPAAQREARIRSLTRQGMPYPVIANSGLKGAAVRELARRTSGQVFFLDDIPWNISSVKAAHEDSHRIHFVADPRLSRLIEQAEDSHYRAQDWEDAHRHMSAILGSGEES